MWTGKKAGLLKCLERSPLGSGNTDEEEVLVDETNITDYEEMVDPVVRLRTRTTSRSTVASNKTVKQDASVQLPTSHVLPYCTLEETAMQNSLMTAFESSSRFCVSCFNFISVQVMNLLSHVGNTGLIATSELIVCIFLEGSIKTHISPFHTSTARP